MVKPNSNNITLHIKDMTVYENTIVVVDVNKGNKPIKVVSYGYDDPRQFLIIKLAEILKPGQTVRISIGFLGNLNDDLTGFYRSSYFDEVSLDFLVR